MIRRPKKSGVSSAPHGNNNNRSPLPLHHSDPSSPAARRKILPHGVIPPSSHPSSSNTRNSVLWYLFQMVVLLCMGSSMIVLIHAVTHRDLDIDIGNTDTMVKPIGVAKPIDVTNPLGEMEKMKIQVEPPLKVVDHEEEADSKDDSDSKDNNKNRYYPDRESDDSKPDASEPERMITSNDRSEDRSESDVPPRPKPKPRTRTTAEANAYMRSQPSTSVDGEKHIKSKLKVLMDLQATTKVEAKALITTRFLGYRHVVDGVEEEVKYWLSNSASEEEKKKWLDGNVELNKRKKEEDKLLFPTLFGDGAKETGGGGDTGRGGRKTVDETVKEALDKIKDAVNEGGSINTETDAETDTKTDIKTETKTDNKTDNKTGIKSDKETETKSDKDTDKAKDKDPIEPPKESPDEPEKEKDLERPNVAPPKPDPPPAADQKLDYPSPATDPAHPNSRVLLKPTVGSHRPHVDAVFAFAEGYDIKIYLGFIESLKATGFVGDLVLSVSALGSLKPGVEDYLRSFQSNKKGGGGDGFNVVVYTVKWNCYTGDGKLADGANEGIRKCALVGMYGDDDGAIEDTRPPRPVATARYELYWSWSLNYDPHSWVMLIDSRDTYFQVMPFEEVVRQKKGGTDGGVDEGVLYFFAENAEASTIGTSKWNKNWLITAYGEPNVSSFFSNPIICSGSTMGETVALESYLRAMVNQFDTTKCVNKGCDQGFHNYLHYSKKLENTRGIKKVVVFEQGKGIINNLGVLRNKPLRERGLLNDQMSVLNWNKSVSYVAHQFDRDDELNRFVKGKRTGFMEAWKKQRYLMN